MVAHTSHIIDLLYEFHAVRQTSFTEHHKQTAAIFYSSSWAKT